MNVENLVPDLVWCHTLAANVQFLEGSDCTMTEAYKLLKNDKWQNQEIRSLTKTAITSTTASCQVVVWYLP